MRSAAAGLGSGGRSVSGGLANHPLSAPPPEDQHRLFGKHAAQGAEQSGASFRSCSRPIQRDIDKRHGTSGHVQPSHERKQTRQMQLLHR